MYNFILHIYKDKSLIYELVKQDIQQRFAGNILGVLWAFLNPLITILIFWFVFEVGFKSQPIQNVPFILWLMAGMIPWFFFSEALGAGTGSIVEKPYLVKKLVFKVSTLPIIKIFAAMYIHLFFLLLLIIVFIVWGFPTVPIAIFQLPYFLICSFFLLLGLSWLTSSLVVFFRDIGNLVVILIQFGFWLTPIFWSHTMMSDEMILLLKLNPVMYITEGFRDSLINNVWFWKKPWYTLYFWSFTSAMLMLGALLFKKLKPHFADVL